MIATAADWIQLRAEFPSLQQFAYLDTASFGQVPRVATEAVINHFKHRDLTASSKFLTWFDDMDAVRHGCAQLVNAHADDIAFIPTASTALSYLMQGLKWEAGDEVITLEGEFPNQLYQGAAVEKFGVNFRAVPWPGFYSSIGLSTRVVLLSTVNYATGHQPPILEISRFLRERGILLYLDGTQSIGALQFDVQAVKPAMLAVDAYKWMLSPNGAGFVYIDPNLRQVLNPTVIGWRSDSGWRQVGSLNHGLPIFAHSAEKFEGGMLPFPSLYGMGAVIEMLLTIGMPAIETRVLELASNTRRMLTELGAEVNADTSQIVTARLPNRDAAKVAQDLNAHRILVSARHGRLRVSSHFYNNESDIECLRAALLG